ncbi:MAG: stress protein [Muribaculaceae bacterium]|nr:stress protein [Muribaculaceae bacterium]MDE5968413.1 stress protein [Muribaculaceae bacterium]
MSIELTTPGDVCKIDLSKSAASANPTITITLSWNDRQGGLFGKWRRRVDLDLGVFYELRDGTRNLIDALQFADGRGGDRDQFTSQGCLTNAPYIWHTGDQRSGGNSEQILINCAHINEIKRLVIYAFIYKGLGEWEKGDAMVNIDIPGQEPINVSLNENPSQKQFCAIAQININGDNTLEIKKLITFHYGHADAGTAYHWGLRYIEGTK